MSCDIVNNKTISAIVYGIYENRRDVRHYYDNPDGDNFNAARLDLKDLTSLGQALVDWNYASYNHRYCESNEPYTFTFVGANGEPFNDTDFILLDVRKTYKPNEVYGCCRYYQYHTCEIPEWYDSAMKVVVDQLENAIAIDAVKRLYGDYPFGMDD